MSHPQYTIYIYLYEIIFCRNKQQKYYYMSIFTSFSQNCKIALAILILYGSIGELGDLKDCKTDQLIILCCVWRPMANEI